MSRNLAARRGPARRRALRGFAALTIGLLGAREAAAQVPNWLLAQVEGNRLACLRGLPEAAIALFACAAQCEPIPWQLDEKTDDGRWALADGPEPNADDPPGVLDDNDVVLWMASDGGRRAASRELPGQAGCTVELESQVAGETRWVYAAVLPSPAPRSSKRYVSYDPSADVVAGERVALGFGAPTPRLLAVRTAGGSLGPNLLDRLKVRAHARFFGIIPLGRDEDDIEWAFAASRAGPIRILRREYQWVRLGFGLRTPIFETESLVTRATVELPVRLRLNFPPTYFFSGIEIQAVLDFRDLKGWSVAAAGHDASPVGVKSGARLDGARGDWVALRGPDTTLVLELVLGETLRSLTSAVVYRESTDSQAPESQRGEMPGVGFRLTEWSAVDRGTHGFAAIAYALPPEFDLAKFPAERAATARVIAAVLRPE